MSFDHLFITIMQMYFFISIKKHKLPAFVSHKFKNNLNTICDYKVVDVCFKTSDLTKSHYGRISHFNSKTRDWTWTCIKGLVGIYAACRLVNSPCRHSGIRAQNDSTIELNGYDGCLRTGRRNVHRLLPYYQIES